MRNFTNFNEFCAHLSKLITKRTPHAGRNVTLEDTPDGFRIHCDPPAPTGTAKSSGTETIINIDLYTQQWIIDVDAGTCTCTGGYIVVNNAVLINLAGSVVNFSAANNNEVLVCQINPDFSVQWVWGASGASAVIAAKPSIVCFLLSLGTNIQLKINARFYEYVTYIATNPVIGV